MLKKLRPAAFSHRSEAHRTEAYALYLGTVVHETLASSLAAALPVKCAASGG